MDYAKLGLEIKNDPVGLGYAGKTNQQIADLLNAAKVQVDRESVTTSELFEGIVPVEWVALTAQEKQRIQMVLSMGTVNLKGTNTRASLGAAFGAGTQTRTNIIALQKQIISRTQYLGIGEVWAGHVGKAKFLMGVV